MNVKTWWSCSTGSWFENDPKTFYASMEARTSHLLYEVTWSVSQMWFAYLICDLETEQNQCFNILNYTVSLIHFNNVVFIPNLLFIYTFIFIYFCLFSRFILYFECQIFNVVSEHVTLYFQTLLVMMWDYCTASVTIYFEYALEEIIRNVLPQIHKNRIITCWPCLSTTNVSLCIFETKQHKMILKVTFHIILFFMFL